jgi:hypothetical protein
MSEQAQVIVNKADRSSASILLYIDSGRKEFCKGKRQEASELARLFAVYKVENGTKYLLGGLAERRESRRRESNRRALEEMAKRKYAEPHAGEFRVVLEEE